MNPYQYSFQHLYRLKSSSPSNNPVLVIVSRRREEYSKVAYGLHCARFEPARRKDASLSFFWYPLGLLLRNPSHLPGEPTRNPMYQLNPSWVNRFSNRTIANACLEDLPRVIAYRVDNINVLETLLIHDVEANDCRVQLIRNTLVVLGEDSDIKWIFHGVLLRRWEVLPFLLLPFACDDATSLLQSLLLKIVITLLVGSCVLKLEFAERIVCPTGVVSIIFFHLFILPW